MPGHGWQTPTSVLRHSLRCTRLNFIGSIGGEILVNPDFILCFAICTGISKLGTEKCPTNKNKYNTQTMALPTLKILPDEIPWLPKQPATPTLARH